MKLTKLIFENYRTFKSRVEIEDLDQINYFIGQNGVGKSNIHKSFEIFHAILTSQWVPSTSDYYGLDDESTLLLGFEVRLKNSDVADLIEKYLHTLNELEIDRLRSLTDGIKIRYRVEFSQKKKTSELLEIVGTDETTHALYEITYKEGSHELQSNNIETLIGDISKSVHSAPSYEKTSGEILSTRALQAWPELADRLRDFFNIEYIRNTREVQDTQKSVEQTTIPTNGKNFAAYHYTITLHGDERILHYQKNVCKLSGGNIESVKTFPKGSTIALKIQERSLPQPLDFNQLSSGRKEIIMFPHIQELNSNIVCIEEPEMHQHANLQKEILDLIKSVVEQNTDIQFFIETHSPVFTGHSSNESTFLILKADDGVVSTIKITDANVNILRQELGISYADVFDHDYFLFVEGASEHIAFEIIAKTLGYNVDKKIKCWNLEGNGNAKNLPPLLTYIKQTNRKICLILDNDHDVEYMVNKLSENQLIESSMAHVLDKSFEDAFTSEQIVTAVSTICREMNISRWPSLEEIEGYRKNKTISKILNPIFHGPSYKPKLARELAVQITEENCNDNQFCRIIKDTLQNRFKPDRP